MTLVGVDKSLSEFLAQLGLVKLGVISASWSVRFYVVLVAVGYGMGLALRAYLSPSRDTVVRFNLRTQRMSKTSN